MAPQEEHAVSETASSTPTLKQAVVCEECKINASKYKCPGCSVRSCSLPCVKAHKLRTGCNGKRPLTNFVPLSQFDDNLLVSDYNMLEDVKRVADSAQRMRVKLCGYSHFRLPFPLKSLRSAAASRQTKLLFLSSGMSKRMKNQTYYNNRKKFISWTIEWRFHSTDIVLIDHGVHENSSLFSLLENHLKPGPWNHQLKKFCEEPMDYIKLFIRKYPKGSRSPFRQLDLRAPLREQLANLVILEYPVIHVFLPSHSYDFEVIKDFVPRKVELEKYVNNDQQSPAGVTFREEEIEDDGSSDPHVLDLKNGVGEHQINKKMNQQNGAGIYSNESSEPSLSESGLPDASLSSEGNGCVSKAEEENAFVGLKAKELTIPEDMGYDYEQGFIDAYPDLIADTNPEDFLDFESLFTKEKDLKGHCEGLVGCVPMEEELEEGEISEL